MLDGDRVPGKTRCWLSSLLENEDMSVSESLGTTDEELWKSIQEARKVLSFGKEPYSKALRQDKFGMYNSQTAFCVNRLASCPSKASGQVKKLEPSDVLDGKGASDDHYTRL